MCCKYPHSLLNGLKKNQDIILTFILLISSFSSCLEHCSLTISKPALLQHLTEALAQLEVSLVLGTLQELLHFILARSKLLLLLLVGRLGCLRLLKQQTPHKHPSTAPACEARPPWCCCVFLPCISVKMLCCFINVKQWAEGQNRLPALAWHILNSFLHYKHLGNIIILMCEQHKKISH